MAAKKISLPVVPLDKLPECHASRAPDGMDEMGYDPVSEDVCQNCADKFTCVRDLPAARRAGKPVKPEEGFTPDNEVVAVLAGDLSYDDAYARMKKRTGLIKAKADVPAELLPSGFKLAVAKVVAVKPAPEPEPEPEEEETEETEESEEGTEETTETEESEEGAEDTTSDDTTETTTTNTKETAAMKNKKTAAKKVPAPKAAAKKAPAKKGAAKKGTRTRIDPSKRVAVNTSAPKGPRFLPQPRELSTEEMQRALSKVSLGQPFDLAVGMQLVRKLRDGSEFVVAIRVKGFETGGVIYPSLTAAAMHLVQRSVNGNTLFSVASQSCTEIRGSGVPGGKYAKEGTAKASKGGKAKPAAAPKKAAKKAPPPPPPAKKKAAKK